MRAPRSPAVRAPDLRTAATSGDRTAAPRTPAASSARTPTPASVAGGVSGAQAAARKQRAESSGASRRRMHGRVRTIIAPPRPRPRAARRPRRTPPREPLRRALRRHVEHRREEQAEDRHAEHPGEHGDAHRLPDLGARPAREHERHDAHDERDRRHQHRPQPHAAGVENRLHVARPRARAAWRTRRSGSRSCTPAPPARGS